MAASLGFLFLELPHVWKDGSLTSLGFSREWSLMAASLAGLPLEFLHVGKDTSLTSLKFSGE